MKLTVSAARLNKYGLFLPVCVTTVGIDLQEGRKSTQASTQNIFLVVNDRKYRNRAGFQGQPQPGIPMSPDLCVSTLLLSVCFSASNFTFHPLYHDNFHEQASIVFYVTNGT